MAEKRCYKIYLTQEQADDVQGFINFNNWDASLEVFTQDERNATEQDITGGTQTNRSDRSASQTLPAPPVVACAASPQAADNPTDDNNDSDGIECIYCYCTPCVTTYPQRWLGPGQRPKPGNNSIRKKIYKEFWKLIDTYGAWNDPRYLTKKDAKLAEDEREQDVWIAMRRGDRHVREIMPDCVLKITRNLYPNPSGIPYMGHRWH